MTLAAEQVASQHAAHPHSESSLVVLTLPKTASISSQSRAGAEALKRLSERYALGLRATCLDASAVAPQRRVAP
jgi:hypothetical protein